MEKKAVFRHGSLDAGFSGRQVWVNSKPKNWRPIKKTSPSDPSASTQAAPFWTLGVAKESDQTSVTPTDGNRAATNTPSPLNTERTASHQIEREESLQETHHFNSLHQFHEDSPRILPEVALTDDATTQTRIHGVGFDSHLSLATRDQNEEIPATYHSSHTDCQALTPGIPGTAHDEISPPYSNTCMPEEGEVVQEACLLRYFIEELSPWVRKTVHDALEP